MSKTGILKIETRSKISKGATKLLRRNGYLPGSISGKGNDSIAVATKKVEFQKSLKKYGRNSVFQLEDKDGSTYTVMVKEIQTTPLTNEYSHVDFQQVSLLDTIKTDVSIKLIGIDILESRRLLLNRQLDIITVAGLPQDVPDFIELNVSNLEAGDELKVSDISFPEGITTESDPNSVLISISESKIQEAVEEEEE